MGKLGQLDTVLATEQTLVEPAVLYIVDLNRFIAL